MTTVQLDVAEDDREVLLNELEGIIEITAGLYRQVGREWDPGDSAALGPDVAPVVGARDQLAGEGPWQLEGSVAELSFLLTRLRMAAELALQRGTQPSPALQSVAMNASDAEGTDAHLDILRACNTLMRQLPADAAEAPAHDA